MMVIVEVTRIRDDGNAMGEAEGEIDCFPLANISMRVDGFHWPTWVVLIEKQFAVFWHLLVSKCERNSTRLYDF